MNTPTPTTADVYLIVGYDGSPPSVRALDTAVGLLRGRTGSIDVVYVPHIPAVDMMSADAVAGMEVALDEIEGDLRKQAAEQLRGREDRWQFERSPGAINDITEVLTGVAKRTRDEHPDDNVAIVVGSSSQATHRLVGSVAVGLARHSPVPVLIVP
jgi:nucleotide-binding universal stress UspA family protein